MVICLGRGADLHMAQLIPLPFTISCSSKSRLVLSFCYQLTRVVPDKGLLNGCCGCCCIQQYYTTARKDLPWVAVEAQVVLQSVSQPPHWLQCTACIFINIIIITDLVFRFYVQYHSATSPYFPVTSSIKETPAKPLKLRWRCAVTCLESITQ